MTIDNLGHPSAATTVDESKCSQEELRAMHEADPLRPQHYFRNRTDGIWTCGCGAQADAFGSPVPISISV